MLFIIILNDNYCISMFNYRGKYHEEFRHGEFPFGLNDNYCISMFNYRGKYHEEFRHGEFPFGLF